MTIAASSSAPFWIAGWVLILALLIGGTVYTSRKRRHRQRNQR
ncbi:MAG TPA: hypothetical protein VFA19_07525 [Gaiellaceae bacterium]|nr:hypothetical protein [Gaiellaceae bacterium]